MHREEFKLSVWEDQETDALVRSPLAPRLVWNRDPGNPGPLLITASASPKAEVLLASEGLLEGHVNGVTRSTVFRNHHSVLWSIFITTKHSSIKLCQAVSLSPEGHWEHFLPGAT